MFRKAERYVNNTSQLLAGANLCGVILDQYIPINGITVEINLGMLKEVLHKSLCIYVLNIRLLWY